VELAQHYGCAGIAWTYNEPSVWFEYTLDSARLAREKGLYTVYVTNGYLTPEALDMIAPYLDVWRVDVKGFNDDMYRRLTRVRHWRSILDVTKRARQKWGMHVEVVTNIIPGMNDDEKQLKKIAGWIRDELGDLVPWHVTRFYPAYRLKHLLPTPLSSLERAYEIGRQMGLKFVYVGNVPGHESENTFCHVCGKMVVRRNGYDARITGLDDRGRCRFCGADLNFRLFSSARKEAERDDSYVGDGGAGAKGF
jgi:pyruvate formate lyase activating enzyme